METLRLHIKYSSGTVSFEFECEGPVDQVLEQAKEWQKTVSVSPRMQLPATAIASTQAVTTPGTTGDSKHLPLFGQEDGFVILQTAPTGDDQLWEAILLTMYGFKLVAGIDEVLVTKLKASLKRLGLSGSIGYATRPYVGSQIIKHGARIGSKYKLTARGIATAKQIADRLVAGMT